MCFFLQSVECFHAQKVICYASEASVLQLLCHKVQWNPARLAIDEEGVTKSQALVKIQQAIDQGGLLARKLASNNGVFKST